MPGHHPRYQLSARGLALGGKDWINESSGHSNHIISHRYCHVLREETIIEINKIIIDIFDIENVTIILPIASNVFITRVIKAIFD